MIEWHFVGVSADSLRRSLKAVEKRIAALARAGEVKAKDLMLREAYQRGLAQVEAQGGKDKPQGL